MPTIRSELQGKGVTFSNAFAVNPLCCPSRASILTGLYSHTHGIYGQVSTSPRVARSFDDRETLATWLKRAGYETALIGKYLNGYDVSWRPRGWDRITAMLHPAGYYNYRLWRDGAVQAYGSAPEDYSTDVLAGDAAAFVEQATGPFLLYFAPVAPHTTETGAPPDAPPLRALTVEVGKPGWVQRLAASDADRLGGMAELAAAQRAALKRLDEGIARILAAVDARGQTANTLFVFMSDNGLTWGEHGLAARKNVPYEPSIRVPFVARYDGHLPAGVTERRIVANVDVAPTVAEAIGVTASTEGMSLFRLLDGSSWRTGVLVEHVGRSIPTYCAIRTETEKYVVYQDGSQELYDLATDPGELVNIRDRERRYDLRGQLGKLCSPKPPGFVWPTVCSRFGDRRSNVIVGRPWFEVVCARHGKDRIFVRDGRRDVVFCGRDRDRVVADPVDEIRPDCEQVRRG